MNPQLHAMETPAALFSPGTGQNRGLLQVQVVSIQNNFPISGATVTISSQEGEPQVFEQLTTNSAGQTQEVSLPAPPESISHNAEAATTQRPYSEYDLLIEAPGFLPLAIQGTEILSGSTAIQPAAMTPLDTTRPPEDPINIPDHTLYGVYRPKIAEAEIQPVAESGEIVLSRVVVPETIVVHDGVPSDRSAPDYYVPYRDYIKNVASS